MEVGVSFSVYDITVPVMVHGLNVMDDYLDHAQALERTKGFEPGRILTERLAPDMITFGEQFSVSCNKVDAHMAKLMQRDRPAPRSIPMMYPALKRRLLETRGFLQNVQPSEIAGAQSHTYELTPPIVRGWFGGEDYIRHLLLPGFLFDSSTTQRSLRQLAATSWKRDSSGNLIQQSGGDYSGGAGAVRGTGSALQDRRAGLGDAPTERVCRSPWCRATRSGI